MDIMVKVKVRDGNGEYIEEYRRAVRCKVDGDVWFVVRGSTRSDSSFTLIGVEHGSVWSMSDKDWKKAGVTDQVADAVAQLGV